MPYGGFRGGPRRGGSGGGGYGRSDRGGYDRGGYDNRPPRRPPPAPPPPGVDPDEYRLSKVMSLVLRHAPEKYMLELDDQGFVSLDRLAGALAERFPFATREYIETFVNGNGARRFIVEDGRVAARYGHSIPVTIDSPPVDPPEFLFLGSSPHLRDRVLSRGLQPDERKWVHLSATEAEARSIGSRKAPQPMILRIHTARAREAGIEFFSAGHLYLCREVPPEAVEIVS